MLKKSKPTIKISMNHRNRFSAAALLLLVASYSYAGEQPERPVPDYAKDLMGCWQEDAGSMLNFEPARCMSFTDGHLFVLSAVYLPGTITLALGAISSASNSRLTRESCPLPVTRAPKITRSLTVCRKKCSSSHLSLVLQKTSRPQR